MAEQIKAVFARHTDRNQLLGYAIGPDADIEAYFSDRKAYGLDIEVIKPVRIADGYGTYRAVLEEERNSLQNQIDELNRQIAITDPRS